MKPCELRLAAPLAGIIVHFYIGIDNTHSDIENRRFPSAIVEEDMVLPILRVARSLSPDVLDSLPSLLVRRLQKS